MSQPMGIRYHGGKTHHLGWLLPMLPPSRTYIEPCLGAATVYLARTPRSPNNLLNDADDRIVHLMATLRDPATREALADAIALTPNARTEFERCRDGRPGEAPPDPVERARRTLVVLQASVSHSLGPGAGWSRRLSTSGGRIHLGRLSGELPALGAAIHDAQLDCQDAAEFLTGIARQQHPRDGADTLVYADPPYPRETRHGMAYGTEMTRADHERLLHALRDGARSRGWKVAVSSYPNELYDQLLHPGDGWRRHDENVLVRTGSTTAKRETDGDRGTRSTRVECLYTNYDPRAHREGMLDLD